MYGIINKGIEDFVLENFGAPKWDAIKKRSGIEIDFFISNEAYDDDITFKLASAISAEMNISLTLVFELLGEWWVICVAKEKYGELLMAGGSNLREFLVNLPIFHNRGLLIYPNLSPPEFKISNLGERSMHIHYYSKREGLQPFIKGLLRGLGKLYKTPAKIELLQSRLVGNNHEIFKVSW